MPDEYDSPWKEILSAYFPDFMEFFFPDAYAGIDWSRGYNFLDKELRQVAREAKLGLKLADKLVRVWHKEGKEVWVLVHVEIQGEAQQGFAKRMYVYNYRIFDRHDRPVMSCAVLTDDQATWRPGRFAYDLWGCEVSFRFPTAKILDYASCWEDLEKSRNPFALTVMAHVKARETKGQHEERALWKWNLVRRLYEQGYKRKEIINLFRFIDWIMQLPEELDHRFWQQVEKYEEEISMQYVTSVERIGLKRGIEQGLHRGIQQGIQQGVILEAQEMVIEVLVTRFGVVSPTVVTKIKAVTSHQVLKSLLHSGVKSVDLAAFDEALQTIVDQDK